jgi:hypothetical protein
MRAFPAPLLALLDAGRIKFAGMIRVDLGEGAFGIIQASSDYVWGGITYKATPRGIVEVTSSALSTGTTAVGFQIRIAESPEAGLTPDQIENWENYDYRDRRVTIFDLHVHPDTGAILGDPVVRARGYINKASHSDDPSSGYILTLECEDRGMDYNRQNGRKRNHADNARRFAGDRFLEHGSTAGRSQQKVDL